MEERTNISKVAVSVSKIDPLDVAEKLTESGITAGPVQETALAVQISKSRTCANLAELLDDFKFGDELPRRRRILFDNGFTELPPLQVEPHSDHAEDPRGEPLNCMVHVWVKSEIGAVYVQCAHQRVCPVEKVVVDYIDLGKMYLCLEEPGGAPLAIKHQCGGYQASLKYGLNWMAVPKFGWNSTSEKIDHPDDLYFRAQVSGSMMTLSVMQSLLEDGKAMPVWPSVEFERHEVSLMFHHPMEWPDKITPTTAASRLLRSRIGLTRADHFGPALEAILNIQPSWRAPHE